ncbi:MAG: polysaccharide biosynthesis tyrosine autokinase [Lachnospiraceae bacterium]|jgi:capsular exopolysaccharide synthesis family protein|nr:polysaccharide biosynthesis tyrosine autokinase [Lachnospiraceae bacterium]
MLTINMDKIRNLDYASREAYKSLRTNVQFCGNDIKVVAITSSIPNEGKSMVSFNLAASMSESGNRVLFVDSDLRKSVLMGRYKINNSIKGLTQYLSGVEEMSGVIYNTNFENLDVVLSGPVPPNPSELLGNESFEKLIEYGRENYDYIIVDTPPIGRVIDAAIVARQCDGIIFLISQGSISYKFAQKQVAQLKKTGCKLLGVILNKVDEEGKGKYYSKYEYKYGKGYY